MQLLRKIDTRVVRQADASLKREIYQTVDVLLQVDRDRGRGDVAAFELAWDDPAGRRLFVAWKRGGELKAGEVDPGEGAFGPKGSPVEQQSRLGAPAIVDGARAIVESSGSKLPAPVLRCLWMCLGQAGPGAQTTATLPGIARRPPSQ